jgi:hypothetical protein
MIRPLSGLDIANQNRIASRKAGELDISERRNFSLRKSIAMAFMSLSG